MGAPTPALTPAPTLTPVLTRVLTRALTWGLTRTRARTRTRTRTLTRAKWWLLHDPEPGSFRSGCGGYVIAGEQSSVEQSCYVNSYEPVLLLLLLCCMSVSGFYLRMPPFAFLLQVRGRVRG